MITKDVNQRTRVPTYQRTQLLSGLYAIVDAGFCPDGDLPGLARRCLEGGCRLLQLRMKEAAGHPPKPGLGERRRAAAQEILALKDRFDFTFIVNDDVDLALELNADGVHVGEHDEPVEAIRGRADGRLLIGYSSHSLQEARAAEAAGADYVAFGAIFPTRTKGPGHPVQGLARLAEVARGVRVPLVAIGGVSRANVGQVVEAGAASVAMITALSMAEDAAAETRWFQDAIASAKRGR